MNAIPAGAWGSSSKCFGRPFASKRAPRDSIQRKLLMKYACILSIRLVATVAFACSAAAVENAHELAGYCQSLERSAKGAGRHIYIPRTREALTCWGYMRAMQDLSVLADENGHRIMGACPPEQTTTLQLIRSFARYARAHRSELPGNAVVAVFLALREAYPCR
jgi:Rap1a immunity proteins